MPHHHFSRGGRSKLEAFRAGYVFLLPKGATWLNRDKPRPFALATDSSPTQLGVFVYGSTRRTELLSAAACVEVMPLSSGVNANRLHAPTFFYPGLMLQIEYPFVPPHLGVLGTKLREFRAALAYALGLGTGTCAHPSAPTGSRRGRIIVLQPAAAARLQTRFAVVLTEHAYSCEKRYQLVVPILRGDGLLTEASILRVPRQHWFGIFPEPTSTALLAPPVIQSVWHLDDIAAETPFVIDAATLDALEERLCAMFGIEARRE